MCSGADANRDTCVIVHLLIFYMCLCLPLDNRFLEITLITINSAKRGPVMRYIVGAIIGAAVGFGIYLVSSNAGAG